MQLGEVRGGGGAAVTALAFHSAGGVLLAAHANGDVVFWEWRRSAWEAAKALKGVSFQDAQLASCNAPPRALPQNGSRGYPALPPVCENVAGA